MPLDELEVLGEPAVEQQALGRIVGIGEFQRVADLVEALVVEGVPREIGPPPIARRDVRPSSRASSLPSFGTSLSSTPGSRQADVAGPVEIPVQDSASGAVSVEPMLERKMMRSPVRSRR